MTPFVIFALPRSRTAWLSMFLTYRDWICAHDEIRHARSLEDVRAWLRQPNAGTIETSAAPWWRLLLDMAPDVRVVTMRRPVPEVMDSLRHLNVPMDDAKVERGIIRLDRKLDQIEHRVPGVLSLQFADLVSEAACAQLFEYCLPYPHDAERWAGLASTNLQIDMNALLRYYRAYEPQMMKLAAIAKQQTIALMARRGAGIDGMTIEQESFDTFYRDGQRLFDEHLVQVGEAPGADRKNVPLMRVLDQMGAMHIMTARSNGRMFGYLMSIISPSMESPSVMTAIQTVYYASPDVPGLGLKLQRASVTSLRALGIGEVYGRAGTRGSGPRMATLFRRLGFSDTGQLFMLDMKEA